MSRPRILFISQVYVPDPAAVGQHLADAAVELVDRGYDVRVIASARGYEDPTAKYPLRETLDGVDVVRLPLSSFGKRTILLRLIGQAVFLLQAIFHGIFTPRISALVVSTSPPMCSVAALIVHWVRRVPIKYWVMDQNPDQMIALGHLSQRSLPVRVFDWLNRRILDAAEDVLVLDRYMAQRVLQKRDVADKIVVLPPWPLEDVLDESIDRDNNPFIAEHNLTDKMVIMYSGNHGPSAPLDTLIEAALRLQDDPRLHFMFVGGGLGKKPVKAAIRQHHPVNMQSLPYQPLSQIKYSLSAADVHVVSLGDAMVGVVHPCKVYGAMAVARPILWFGPRPSHVSDLLEQYNIGWQIAHGDVDGAVAQLQSIADAGRCALQEMGCRARKAVRSDLSKAQLCGAACDVLSHGLPLPTPQRSAVPADTRDRQATVAN